MFLTIDELKTNSLPVLIQKIINNDVTIVEEIIAESIDEMKGYLIGNYNADSIFSKTGTDRSKTILKHLKRIVKYELYKRKDQLIDEDTLRDYDETMSWLRDVAKGVLSLNIPIEEEDQPAIGDGFIKYGSGTRYNSKY